MGRRTLLEKEEACTAVEVIVLLVVGLLFMILQKLLLPPSN